MMNTRTNQKIEVKVLATLILDADLLIECNEVLSEQTFSRHEHRQTFEVIQKLFMQNIGVNVDVVANELERNGVKFNVYEIMKFADSGRNIRNHSMMLRELEIARDQIQLGVQLAALGNDEKTDPLATNDLLIRETDRITSLTDVSRPRTNVELIKANTDRMEAANANNGMTGISTGFHELDHIYGGRQNSDLIIKAGRPGMGKTAQALCEAYNMAMMGEQNVVFFSLEMGAEQLIQRLISIHTGIELSIIRSGQLSQTQWDQYNKQVNDLMGDNLTIIDDVYTLTNICTRCKKLRMQKKMGVVFIDYLQLIIHKVDSGRSKANEVSEISRALKMLAKGLNIPVIALSQLNRSCESRADKKPLLSDLRESGSIEQDADIVEMIYRPEYYAEIKDADTNGELTGRAWILIQKNRHGSTRDVEFDFNAECTKFENTNKNHHNQTPF